MLGLHGSKGHSLDATSHTGTRNNHHSHPVHRQRGSVQSEPTIEVCLDEPTHQAPLPQPESTTPIWQPDDKDDRWEGQPGGPPNETPTHECDQRMNWFYFLFLLETHYSCAAL